MIHKWELSQNKATYILRYFLPRPPYVSKETTLQRLEELISFCRRTHVEAVQFYVNLRDDWCYMPDRPEHAVKWAEEMKSFVPEIRKAGISYQLNFQNLLGAHTGGTDLREDYPWEYLVDHRGNVCQGCACPIGARFREIMGRQLRVWADTRPDVIWIDDDFRMHNHGLSQGGLDWYCYCPEHLELFSKRFGRTFTREELIKCITKSGEPSRERIAWLDFLNETMVDTASWICEQVHEISPFTRMAQMISLPDIHSVEGRNWGDFLSRLSDKEYLPITRPHFGPYTETSPGSFISSYTILDQTLVTMKMQYPGGTDACPELENTRFTRWAKSTAATRYQLILGQLLGCRGITLSLYDLEGTPLDEEPLYEKILAEEKPSLDQLAKLRLAEWKPRGVGLPIDPDSARKVQILEEAGSTISSLMGPGRTWDNTLLTLGVPAHYLSSKEASMAEVVALDGLTAWLPDDKEMGVILSKGVLLDSKAAEVLILRGYGSMIGVNVGDTIEFQTSAEVFHSSVLEELPEKRMPLRIAGGRWSDIIPGKSAKILSDIIDPKGMKHPGMVLYENSACGRVATYAGCIDVGAEFYNHARVLWCSALLNWLSKGVFPVQLQAAQRILTIRRDRKGSMLLAFSNLAADTIEELKGTVKDAGKIKSVKMMCTDGKWKRLEDSCFQETSEGEYSFHLASKLPIYNWLVLLADVQ